MGERPVIVSLLLLLVMVVSLFTPSTAVSSVDGQFSLGVKEEDRVYVDDTEAYISAEPRTLTADGYVYLNVTSKAYGGELDLCFGFDSKQAYPTRLELYDPQVEVVQHELNVSVYWGRPEYRVSYNFTKAVGNTVYGGCVWVDYDNEFISSANKTSITDFSDQTAFSEWVTVLTQHFDVGYLDAKMFFWSTEETSYWRNILPKSVFEEEAFMGTTDLNTDAYTETTDNSNRCFIGFDNFSIWYRNSTEYQGNIYGDFVQQFFYHLLQGSTIKEALNYASYDTHGEYYNQCPLYYGYDMVDPRWPYPTVRCYMRVHGDGDLVIPH